jgi:hypothetical protein
LLAFKSPAAIVRAFALFDDLEASAGIWRVRRQMCRDCSASSDERIPNRIAILESPCGAKR